MTYGATIFDPRAERDGRRPLDNGSKIQTLCAGPCVLHTLFPFVEFQKRFHPPMTLLLILLLTYVCNQAELFGLLCLG